MTTKNVILAIDQGTTGSRAILYDAAGREVSKAYCEFPQFYPNPGWVEHDPLQIWYSVLSVVKRVQNERRFKICAVGISNQRETTILWDAVTGKPVSRAIVWQDRRTSEFCSRLVAAGYSPVIRQKTGLVIDAYFSASKINWLLKHSAQARHLAKAGRLKFGTIDTWLLWQLTGGKSHATDFSNASRTLLLNIHSRNWDKDLLSLFNVPASCLPQIKNSGDYFGETSRNSGIPTGIPIYAMMGDQQAALYGQSCYDPGSIKNTYGTGCFLMMNSGNDRKKPVQGLLSTLACDRRGKAVYALEGAVFIAGAAIQWLRDGLGFFKHAKETERIIRNLKSSGGVTVIPAFVGLGSPYWNSEVRGAILGITRGTTAAHIIRACLESIAHQSADVIELMRAETKKNIAGLRADGGATANKFLMQFQADIIQKPIRVSSRSESTAWGVSKLAGRQCGFWGWNQTFKSVQDVKIEPRMHRKDAARHRLAWKKQVSWLLKSN